MRDFPRVIIVEDSCNPSSLENDICQVYQVNLASSWMDPISKYLESDILLEERVEAEKIRRKTPQFWLFEDKKFYKRSFSRLCLLCMHLETTESILEELHEGICGSHMGRKIPITPSRYTRILVAKHAKGSAGVC